MVETCAGEWRLSKRVASSLVHCPTAAPERQELEQCLSAAYPQNRQLVTSRGIAIWPSNQKKAQFSICWHAGLTSSNVQDFVMEGFTP